MFTFFKKNHILPKKITIKKEGTIFETEEGVFFLKKKKRRDIGEVYQYLERKDFSYFLKPINKIKEDNYELYPFCQESDISVSEELTELIYILSVLHNKTTYYEVFELDELKQIYEETKERIQYLSTYYQELEDIIDMHVYMSPSEYFLVRNISTIYMALSFAKEELETWYHLVTKNRKKRMVLLHNDVRRTCFLAKENKLINWDQAKRGIPIYDFYHLCRNEPSSFDFATLFCLYEKKYPLIEEEKTLLFVLLSIPWKITLDRNEQKKCEEISELFAYLENVRLLLSKENKVPAKE